MAFYLRKSPHIATYFLFGRALAILRVPATQTWHGNQRKQKKMNKENTNDRGMAASLPWMCLSNGGAEASRIIFQRNLRQWTSNEPIHCAHVWNCRIFIHFFFLILVRFDNEKRCSNAIECTLNYCLLCRNGQTTYFSYTMMNEHATTRTTSPKTKACIRNVCEAYKSNWHNVYETSCMRHKRRPHFICVCRWFSFVHSSRMTRNCVYWDSDRDRE